MHADKKTFPVSHLKNNRIMDLKKLADQYKDELLDNVLPFLVRAPEITSMVGILPVWTGKGMFLTQTNLFGYRAEAWLFSMLYNKVEKRQEWLDCAIQGGEFLKNMVMMEIITGIFLLIVQDVPLVEPYNIFSYTFCNGIWTTYWLRETRSMRI